MGTPILHSYPGGVWFVLGTLGVLALIVGVMVVVGHFYPGSSAELVDWKPTRSPDVEAQNEIDDVRQMLEAQNEMRRRRGAPEMTEEELQAGVAEDERLRMRGRGPFEPT
jgi:hypothetical protein